MARRCKDCQQTPCMGGGGVGSCVSTAGKKSRESGGTISQDEEPGTRKNPMINCTSSDEDKIEGVWHTTHSCEIKVPKLSPFHLQAHRCTCGHTWR
jgi:hypothetical protein